jgi:hypothetical protein
MSTLTPANGVPRNLRRWFVIHFVADILFAIPLLLIPEVIMPLVGWKIVDPITSRLVGAALLGIGVESLLGRNASREVFKAMLNLKVVWASGAVLGITLGIIVGAPASAWLFLAIFVLFLIVWSYYWITLR